MSVCCLLILFVSLFVKTSFAANPLKSWKLCPQSSPDMNGCLKKAVEDAIHGLKDGNPKLGVMPIDPLHLNTLIIDQATGPVSISLKFNEIDITGIGSVIIDSFKADWTNAHLEAEAHFEDPHFLGLTGDYEIDGKVLMLPIKGEGKCNLTFDNFKAKLFLDGKHIQKGGEDYLDIETMKVDLDTSKLHIDFEKLFNGDKALGNQMNIFLNENWSEILHELKPAISKSIGAAGKHIANLVFHKIPLKKLAPP